MNYKSHLKENKMPRAGDLIDTVDRLISIDEFEPKMGHEFKIIVVAFYFKEEAAAEDFRMFIERGVCEFLDIEVSPNPDTNGEWPVFIEIERNNKFWDTLEFLLKETDRLIGEKGEWLAKVYHEDVEFTLEEAKTRVLLKPSQYALKKARDKSKNESVEWGRFLEDVVCRNCTLSEGLITFHGHREKLTFKVDSFGELNENDDTPIQMSSFPREVRLLEKMLGTDYTVDCFKNKVFVQKHNTNEVLILDRYV